MGRLYINAKSFQHKSCIDLFVKLLWFQNSSYGLEAVPGFMKKKSMLLRFVVFASFSCLLGVAKFLWGNHVLQNLRAHFILYVVKTKCIKCMWEKIEFPCMLYRPRLISTNILGDLSMTTMIKQQSKIARKFSGVAKGWHPVAQRGIWYPIPPWLRAFVKL